MLLVCVEPLSNSGIALGGFATGMGFYSGTLPPDHHPTGINPRRDGYRGAIVCWLRFPSDGDKSHRNDDGGAVHRIVPR
jgi:hypothetical protein